jgi:aminopeptidase N
MKKTCTIILIAGVIIGMTILGPAMAQGVKKEDPALKIYRETPAKINDLIHTKLDVRFDYKKQYLYGKEWITLTPHFYPTDTLRLDAKGMDINTISIVKYGKNIPLKFAYDSLTLAIKLDKVYHNKENYSIYIEYTAKPKPNGSRVNKENRGLYFINPDGKEKDKPTQIWTEGEPESSSAWFPTIDKPNQKTTEEIRMTVPAKYVTLSNGRLASQKTNGDGTRTDTWKMDWPNAPYLFMMAVGDFKIYKDNWHGKEVSYYLEPKYAPYAKDIFGFTPEAIDFFSKITGVDYPWNKYSQIVVRDYVSGAMENTTAMMTGEPEQATKRELVDRVHDFGPVHELFHQWFGDYVTCESWSNLTLNESFADLGEILWGEYKYGQDAADEHIREGLQGYLSNTENVFKPLVNFYYTNKKDVFNGVTYQKGGRVLNMLRHYLGNAAFYKGLNIYLTTNALKSAEAQQLRLAMEEASGLDLNWFFNQWYYGAGHPVLDINYKWDDATKTQTVYLAQKQEGQTFILPMYIDIYAEGKKQRHQVWMHNKQDTLAFSTNVKPKLVNVDAEKILITQKTDNKTPEEYYFQYFNAPLYLDRFEAIEIAAKNEGDKDAQKVLIASLQDKYYGLRLKAIEVLNQNKESIKNANEDLRNAALPVLAKLIETENNTQVRAAAINTVAWLKEPRFMDLFIQALNSQSYEVQGAALAAIGLLDPDRGMSFAKGFEKDNEGSLTSAIIRIYATKGSTAEWHFVYNKYSNATLQDKIHLTAIFAEMTGRINNPIYAQQGIETLKTIAIKYKPEGAGPYISKYLNLIREQRAKLNDDTSAKVAADAIKEINDAK